MIKVLRLTIEEALLGIEDMIKRHSSRDQCGCIRNSQAYVNVVRNILDVEEGLLSMDEVRERLFER